MVGPGPIRSDKTDLRQGAGLNVLHDLRGIGRIVPGAHLNHITKVGVFRRCDATVTGYGGVADSLNSVGRGPIRCHIVGVVSPADSGGIEHRGNRIVVVAGISGDCADKVGVRPAWRFRGLAGSDLQNRIGDRTETAAGTVDVWVFRGKPFVIGGAFAIVVYRS